MINGRIRPMDGQPVISPRKTTFWTGGFTRLPIRTGGFTRLYTHPNRWVYQATHPNRWVYQATHPNRWVYQATHPNRWVYQATHPRWWKNHNLLEVLIQMCCSLKAILLHTGWIGAESVKNLATKVQTSELIFWKNTRTVATTTWILKNKRISFATCQKGTTIRAA